MPEAKSIQRRVRQLTASGSLRAVAGLLGRQGPAGRRAFVVDMLPPGSEGVEVGVWKGEFSVELLRSAPRQLHLVDPWRFAGEHPGALYGGLEAHTQADMDEIHAGVVRRFARRPEVTVHRMGSLEAAPLFADGAVDWAYIDGDHSYEAVRDDLEAWAPKVRPGGILAGDDYGEGGWWEDGVRRAADDFAAARGWPLLALRGQFIMQAPGG